MAAIRRRFTALLCLGCSLAGCDFMTPAKIDAPWHRQQLLGGILSHWLAVSPTGNGYMAPAFTRDWRPIAKPQTSLILQSRNIYAFASGYEASGDPRYLDATRRGADFLLRYFHDPVYGGWYQSVAADGQVVGDAKESYGHAFAILGLAHAYRATHDERYREAALETWRVMRAKLRDRLGGFRRSAPRNFDPGETVRTQNPVMHLFEALLALYEATGSEEAMAGALGVGDFVLNTLLRQQGGAAHIEEWYDENWLPLADDKGGYTDLGHQFEWAYLLSHAGTLGFPETYSQAAEQVLDYALQTGYDDSQGGSFYRASASGAVERAKEYWEQSECLRVLMHFMVVRGKASLRPRYEQTLQYIEAEWLDDANGGWRLKPKSQCETADCPNEQPDAYHMTAMHMEALALAARQGQQSEH